MGGTKRDMDMTNAPISGLGGRGRSITIGRRLLKWHESCLLLFCGGVDNFGGESGGARIARTISCGMSNVLVGAMQNRDEGRCLENGEENLRGCCVCVLVNEKRRTDKFDFALHD